MAKRQLTKIKEEKLCQMERIIVVEKIAKIEDELKVIISIRFLIQ